MDEYIAETRYDRPEIPREILGRVRSQLHQLLDPDRWIERMFSSQTVQIVCPMCNRRVTDSIELGLMEQSGLCSQCTSVQAGQPWTYYREPTLVEIGTDLTGRTPTPLESLIILRHLEQLGAPTLEILHGQWKDLSYVQVDGILAGVCVHCMLLGEQGIDEYTISRLLDERGIEEYRISRTSKITGITYTDTGCRSVALRWFPDLEKA